MPEDQDWAAIEAFWSQDHALGPSAITVSDSPIVMYTISQVEETWVSRMLLADRKDFGPDGQKKSLENPSGPLAGHDSRPP